MRREGRLVEGNLLFGGRAGVAAPRGGAGEAGEVLGSLCLGLGE